MLPSNHLGEITSFPGRHPSFSSCDKAVPLADSGEHQQNTEGIPDLLSTTHTTARGILSMQHNPDWRSNRSHNSLRKSMLRSHAMGRTLTFEARGKLPDHP